jgi:hypothetical protein
MMVQYHSEIAVVRKHNKVVHFAASTQINEYLYVNIVANDRSHHQFDNGTRQFVTFQQIDPSSNVQKKSSFYAMYPQTEAVSIGININ